MSASTCHVEDGARYIGCGIAQQPDHGFRDFIRFADASDRRGGTQLHTPVGPSAAGMNFRVDMTGTHRVYTDSFGAELLGQAEGPAFHGPLGPGLVHVLLWRAHP